MNVHPFSDLEGLRIAAEMESRGGRFYQRAARIVRDPALQEMLVDMAEEEKIHLSQFQRLYDLALELGGDQIYDEETNAYLSALAAEYVFPGGLAEMMCEPTAQGILQASIRSEQEAIAFYTRMGQAAHLDSARRRFEEIASTEQAHLESLQVRLDQVSSEK